MDGPRRPHEEFGRMKKSNRIMLLGGVVGVILTAVSPVFAGGGKGAMWLDADTNKDGSIDRAEFDALRGTHFAAFDANSDGLLTAEEFKAAREKRRAEMKSHAGQNGDVSRHGEGMLKRIDTSGDGRVTADEWQASSLQRFVRLDADGDGAISAEEMSVRHGKGMDGDAAGGHRMKMGHGGMLDRADSDGDGQISRAEWDAAGTDMFARMDQNGDGKIAVDELPHKRKKDGNTPILP
jgi:Ca2+-binding EF-hand superfamily protein